MRSAFTHWRKKVIPKSTKPPTSKLWKWVNKAHISECNLAQRHFNLKTLILSRSVHWIQPHIHKINAYFWNIYMTNIKPFGSKLIACRWEYFVSIQTFLRLVQSIGQCSWRHCTRTKKKKKKTAFMMADDRKSLKDMILTLIIFFQTFYNTFKCNTGPIINQMSGDWISAHVQPKSRTRPMKSGLH